MTSTNDPLDFFFDITSSKKYEEDPEAFPGKTPPKNRGKSTRASHEWLDSLPSKEYLVGGAAKRFYTIGAVAQALGRKPVTIRSWEAKGWLPPASFRSPPPAGTQLPDKPVKGRRLYSEHQLVTLVEGAIQYGLSDPEPDWDGFRQYIQEHYPKH